MIKHLQPVHTSTIARFGTAQLDKKCNVNCLRTVPDRTELARSIPPGWHGSTRFVCQTAPVKVFYHKNGHYQLDS